MKGSVSRSRPKSINPDAQAIQAYSRRFATDAKHAEIGRENRKLVEKLTTIAKTSGQCAPPARPPGVLRPPQMPGPPGAGERKRSLNADRDRQRQYRVDQDNAGMVRRILSVKSTFDPVRDERNYQRHRRAVNLLQRMPDRSKPRSLPPLHRRPNSYPSPARDLGNLMMTSDLHRSQSGPGAVGRQALLDRGDGPVPVYATTAPAGTLPEDDGGRAASASAISEGGLLASQTYSFGGFDTYDSGFSGVTEASQSQSISREASGVQAEKRDPSPAAPSGRAATPVETPVERQASTVERQASQSSSLSTEAKLQGMAGFALSGGLEAPKPPASRESNPAERKDSSRDMSAVSQNTMPRPAVGPGPQEEAASAARGASAFGKRDSETERRQWTQQGEGSSAPPAGVGISAQGADDTSTSTTGHDSGARMGLTGMSSVSELEYADDWENSFNSSGNPDASRSAAPSRGPSATGLSRQPPGPESQSSGPLGTAAVSAAPEASNATPVSPAPPDASGAPAVDAASNDASSTPAIAASNDASSTPAIAEASASPMPSAQEDWSTPPDFTSGRKAKRASQYR